MLQAHRMAGGHEAPDDALGFLEVSSDSVDVWQAVGGLGSAGPATTAGERPDGTPIIWICRDGANIVIGRRSDTTLRIRDAAVSSRHICVRAQE